MKWAAQGDHRRYFEEHGHVGFDGLIAPFQVEPLEGRDLWRRSDSYKAISASRRIGGLVAELTQVKPVRLAYDQMGGVGPLSEQACVQEVLCALVLDLSTGSGLFVAPDYAFENRDALLVVYVTDPAIYVHNPRDPYTGQWKRLGIGYGDRLKDPTFPTLARA